ncbi:hypothetical protein C2S53_010136 [Perilla frutescens var. hirtella]|uniref:Uncharacterized protein n=1 Tax=Perilla frutescens var. hirtella TaxID=608512 RepID=A0AAD4JBF2_PERFH|nr:hypothetical protein C2S53_010136 [Perilla frutescens var. hirtella]
MNSETTITQRDHVACQNLSSNSDPSIRYPIPSEKTLREEQRASVFSRSNGSRRIAFAGDGTQVIVPVNLPFKPPAPRWNGHHCITTRQLQNQRDTKMAKK